MLRPQCSPSLCFPKHIYMEWKYAAVRTHTADRLSTSAQDKTVPSVAESLDRLDVTH